MNTYVVIFKHLSTKKIKAVKVKGDTPTEVNILVLKYTKTIKMWISLIKTVEVRV